jgi:metal-sulfur cluster biosynthetic enzyme
MDSSPDDRFEPTAEAGDAPAVLDALRGVYDPCCREKGISIVDMGLVRSIEVQDGLTRVELLLTSGWCPFAARMLSEARQVVEALPHSPEVSIEVVWSEAWTMDRVSETARAKLRFLPDPAQVPDRDRYVRGRLPQNSSMEVTADDR